MPELPEVETIRRGLQRKILRKKIVGVVVRKPKMVKNPLRTFMSTLKGSSFIKIGRKGKLLVFELGKSSTLSSSRLSSVDGFDRLTTGSDRVLSVSQKYYLLVHLKMTGQLVYQNKKIVTAGGHPFPAIDKLPQYQKAQRSKVKKENGYLGLSLRGFGPTNGRNSSFITGVALPNKYSHIILTFKDGSQLFFNDQRQFGYMQIVNQKQKEKVLSQFGIEPLTKDFTLDKFNQIFKNRKTATKNILLNQSVIAGIGNIYADEVCFMAKVRPQKKANRLTKDEKKQLFLTCNKVLKLAINKGGTTFSDYRNADGGKGKFVRLLKVYQRAGEKCKRCRKGTIKRIKLGGRGTHYCPNCQK